MHTYEWLDQGTVFWKREGQTFSVFPAFQYTIGMLHPEKNVKYGFDQAAMDKLLYELQQSFRYDPNLLWNKSVRRLGNHDDTEMNYAVDSLEFADRRYLVTLLTIADERDDPETINMSLKNMDYVDDCSYGDHKGRLCAMDQRACERWNIFPAEWERRQSDHGISKVYGKVADDHVVSAIREIGIYPPFDERRFQQILPDVYGMFMQTPKRENSRGRMVWYEEDLDFSLKPVLQKMGFEKMSNYFHALEMTNAIRKDMMDYFEQSKDIQNVAVRDFGEFDAGLEKELRRKNVSLVSDDWRQRFSQKRMSIPKKKRGTKP